MVPVQLETCAEPTEIVPAVVVGFEGGGGGSEGVSYPEQM